MVILAILKLRSVNNLLIVNLLFTYLPFIFVCAGYTTYLVVVYFFDLETNYFCPSGIDVVKGNYTDGYSTGCLSHCECFVSIFLQEDKKIIAMIIVLWLSALFAAVVFAFRPASNIPAYKKHNRPEYYAGIMLA